MEFLFGTRSAKTERKTQGNVKFRHILALYPVGSAVYWWDSTGMIVGGEVVLAKMQKGTQWNPDYINIRVRSLLSSGSAYWYLNLNKQIWSFDGAVPIEDLPCVPLGKRSKLYDELTSRGRICAKRTRGTHHMHYTGHLMLRTSFGVRRLRAEGRLMVDHKSFGQHQPNHWLVQLGRGSGAWTQGQGRMHRSRFGRNKNRSLESVPDDKHFMVWPTALVFSLRAKSWGEADIMGLQDIKFDDKAFSQLVRPEKEKALITTLVRQTFEESEGKRSQGKLQSTDFISGKGGGAVFLLHGNPGTGKTLTAESLAENLKRPLYTVSVGELGTTARTLETSLNKILELAAYWRAIILLDEADIFLEKRSVNDVNRSALVGVFLRLLEYHDGIIFLTTNRVRCFDPAFKSRISLSLHYTDLTGQGRTTIWAEFFKKHGVKGLDAKRLGVECPLNGRQIRNCFRLARALAESEGAAGIQMRHIIDTHKIVLSLDTLGSDSKNAFGDDIATTELPTPEGEEVEDEPSPIVARTLNGVQYIDRFAALKKQSLALARGGP